MLRINEIKVEVCKNTSDNIKKAIAKKLKIRVSDILNYEIRKQSIDARDKEAIYYNYKIDVKINNENKICNKNNNISIVQNEEYKFECIGTQKLAHKPIIVGAGPAGLFCAYILCEAGYNPIIIERGEKIEDRIKSVNEFWETGNLNLESNVQFGEGGAGTFSDGKLNTLINDKNNRMKKVFEVFVKCGAPKEILYSYKPHIGTNLLRKVIKNMRKEILNMGGEIIYNACLTNIEIKYNKIKSIEINSKERISCECLVLAIGHSARDTFKMLLDSNLNIVPKPFAIGLRVQHKQDDINKSQYGDKYKNILPPATYKLTYQSKCGRGVYSFCMCPGGYVVNASSENNRLVINGMSNHERESENANSAIIVTISPDDFGYSPLDGVKYQKVLEEHAYKLGNGKIPVQLLKDFKENRISTSYGKVNPIFKGEYIFSNLRELFNNEINNSIIEAFENFESKIKGFNSDDVILAGVESRTSSPVRILRDENLESNMLGIYPCGEGAGYAGGITSSAMDGIKVAESIGKKYKNKIEGDNNYDK